MTATTVGSRYRIVISGQVEITNLFFGRRDYATLYRRPRENDG